jgi:hypothetical protein
LNRDFPKLTSLSFSLRPSVLRHVMYTIVDRYDNERETWSKSTPKPAPYSVYTHDLVVKAQQLDSVAQLTN